MARKTLLFVAQKRWAAIKAVESQLRATCDSHKLQFQMTIPSLSEPTLRSAVKVRDADYCVIWNGFSIGSAWGVKVRHTIQRHYTVIECGWFPQREYWGVDATGLVGCSELCGDLADPTTDQLRTFTDTKDRCIKRVKNETPHPDVPEGAIVVPLQLPRDMSVYGFAPYKRTVDFIAHAVEKFGDQGTPVVIKTHPKQRKLPVRTGGAKNITVVRDGSWDAILAAKPSFVYGQTSTTLYEAAMVDVPVVAIGNCPLKFHNTDGERETLLAHMAARQVSRASLDLWEQIRRYSSYSESETDS